VGQILAGDLQTVRPVHVAAGQHHAAGHGGALAGLGLGRQEKAAGRALDVHHRLVGVDAQVELLDDAAQIGQVLLAGSAPLDRVLDRHARDLDALGGAEEGGVARPPGHGVADLLRVEVQILHPQPLQAHRQLDADRPRADDGDLCGWDRVVVLHDG